MDLYGLQKGYIIQEEIIKSQQAEIERLTAAVRHFLPDDDELQAALTYFHAITSENAPLPICTSKEQRRYLQIIRDLAMRMLDNLPADIARAALESEGA